MLAQGLVRQIRDIAQDFRRPGLERLDIGEMELQLAEDLGQDDLRGDIPAACPPIPSASTTNPASAPTGKSAVIASS
jgi:hypothetical protein